MNKTEMIKAVANETGFTQKDIKTVLDVLQNVVVATLPNEPVKLFDGLTLETVERAARAGHNPQTGEPLTIPARVVPKAKFGKVFKEAVA